MPTRATSPSKRTHSCSLVYFRSSGNSMPPPWALRASRRRMERARRRRYLVERVRPDVVRGWEPAPSSSFGYPRLVQRANAMSAARAVAKTRAGGSDPPIAAFRTDPQVLSSGELPPLRSRPPLELHDVQGEIHHRRVADGRAHAVGVDVSIETHDGGLVDATGDEDLHVGEPGRVQLPPDLPEDRAEVAPAARRRVQADGGEPLPQDPRRGQGPELLVLERV